MPKSLKKLLPQKTHKERQQLSSRRHLGPLEKHKDYLVRARKTHQRQAQQKLLREQAKQKNPDEYSHEMTRAHRTKDGTTIVEKVPEHKKGLVTDRMKRAHVTKTASKNLNLLRYKHSILVSKIEKLKQSLHFIDLSNEKSIGEKNDDNFGDSGEKKQKMAAKHTIFVKNRQELETFDPQEYFDTDASLVSQAYNRVKRSDLLKSSINNQQQHTSARSEEVSQATMKQYRELERLIEKERVLRKAMNDLEMAKSITVDGAMVEAYERDDSVNNANFNTKLKNVVAVRFKQERKR